jgi:RNA polymerase sigma-70 factor (ECF subfamily)
MEDRTDAELVEAARAGDADSFGELYRRHYAAAVGIAYSALSDRQLAEDAAQDAFVVACQKLSCLRHGGLFARWVCKIGRRKAAQMARLRSRARTPERLAGPTREGSGAELREVVAECIDRLPRQAKEVVVLHYFSGLPYNQIAVLLNISPNAVHGRLIRARRKIAEGLMQRGLGRRQP